MKVCLNSKQSKKYLLKADQIKVQYEDISKLLDIGHAYRHLEIILDLNINEIDWEQVKQNSKLVKRLVCCCDTYTKMSKCKEIGVEFYYGFSINNFYDLRALKDIGASYIKLAPPLTHMIPEVSKIGIPIRLVPNIAYEAYFPRKDGVCGQWVRPENIDEYAKYIDIIEFEDCDLRKEQALYRIYAEQKEWPGDLSDLITNLNATGVNRMINPEDSIRRMTCGQRCMQTGSCHLCYSFLTIANPGLLKPILQSQNNKK